MRKYNIDNATLFVGSAREICSLYRNLSKRELAYPAFCDMPKFNMTRFYGLVVTDDMDMQVVSNDTALRVICDMKGGVL